MQAQLTAHRATVEMIRDQAEKEKQSSLDTQQERHNKNLGECIIWCTFTHRHTLTFSDLCSVTISVSLYFI